MFAVRAAVAPAQPARKRRACGRAFTRSGARPRRAVGDETDAWMTRDMPPPLLDAPHALGDARDDPAATTSETRVPSEDAETVASSLRSTDAEDESSRRETTETATETTASDDDDELSFVRNANALEPDPERFWRARLSSLSNSWMPRSVDREALKRRLNDTAARVADALPADLAESLAKALRGQKRRVSTVLRRVRGLADAWTSRAPRGRHGAIRDDSRLIVSETRSVDEDVLIAIATSPASPALATIANRDRAFPGSPTPPRRRFCSSAGAWRALPVHSGTRWSTRRRGAVARLSPRARAAGHHRQRLGAVRRDPCLRRRARRRRRRQPATRGSRGALQRRR